MLVCRRRGGKGGKGIDYSERGGGEGRGKGGGGRGFYRGWGGMGWFFWSFRFFFFCFYGVFV